MVDSYFTYKQRHDEIQGNTTHAQANLIPDDVIAAVNQNVRLQQVNGICGEAGAP